MKLVLHKQKKRLSLPIPGKWPGMKRPHVAVAEYLDFYTQVPSAYLLMHDTSWRDLWTRQTGLLNEQIYEQVYEPPYGLPYV